MLRLIFGEILHDFKTFVKQHYITYLNLFHYYLFIIHARVYLGKVHLAEVLRNVKDLTQMYERLMHGKEVLSAHASKRLNPLLDEYYQRP